MNNMNKFDIKNEMLLTGDGEPISNANKVIMTGADISYSD